MEEKKLVPKRRFREFMTDWKPFILGEVSNIIGGGTPSTSVNEYWNGEIDWYTPVEIGEEVYVNNSERKISKLGFENSSTNLLPAGTILFTSRAGIGKTAILQKEGTTNQGFQSIIPMKNILDSYFIYSRSNELKNFGETNASGSTFLEISGKEMENMKINLPDIKEQQKIGEFFRHFDEMIALQQKKIDKTKALKSAYLAEMFPAEGERVPKRRFAGFTEDWEERYFMDNIKNIIDFRGRTPKKLGLNWSEKGYLALSALNVKNGYIDFNADAYYGDQELYEKWMNGRELREGQVLFTTEAPMGNVAQVPDNRGYILSQRTIAFNVIPEKITNSFMASLLRSDRTFMELSNLSSGGTAKGVSQRTLEELKVFVPNSINEQIKIGNFFKNLDDIISNHQQKLEKLQATKQAYLNEMFV